MKRLISITSALLFLLSGCGQKDDPTAPKQNDTECYYLSQKDFPLQEGQPNAVPNFLDETQQFLYCQAFALYSAMFDGETTGIDDAFPAANCQTEYDEYTPDGSDYTYISSHSRWQSALSTRCSPIRSGLPAMTTATRRSTSSMTVGFLSSTAHMATNITTATFLTNLL